MEDPTPVSDPGVKTKNCGPIDRLGWRVSRKLSKTTYTGERDTLPSGR